MVLFWISTELKQGSVSLIQAEPAELHFSGFQLQKEYTKTVVRTHVWFEATRVFLGVSARVLTFPYIFRPPQKLINSSSQVLNLQVVPTQTDHFQTTSSRKVSLGNLLLIE